MQLTGTLRTIRNIQQISDKFQKREFIIETQGQYKQTIQLELKGDKCDIIDAYTVGEEIVCDINIEGRIWVNPQGEEKCFNTISCWKIQRPNASQGQGTAEDYAPPSTNSGPKEFHQANQPNSFVDGDDTDFQDLPFK